MVKTGKNDIGLFIIHLCFEVAINHKGNMEIQYLYKYLESIHVYVAFG